MARQGVKVTGQRWGQSAWPARGLKLAANDSWGFQYWVEGFPNTGLYWVEASNTGLRVFQILGCTGLGLQYWVEGFPNTRLYWVGPPILGCGILKPWNWLGTTEITAPANENHGTGWRKSRRRTTESPSPDDGNPAPDGGNPDIGWREPPPRMVEIPILRSGLPTLAGRASSICGQASDTCGQGFRHMRAGFLVTGRRNIQW